jgi:hypothetical protein
VHRLVRHAEQVGEAVQHGDPAVLLPLQRDPVDRDHERRLVRRPGLAGVVDDQPARCGGDDVTHLVVGGRLLVLRSREHLQVPQPAHQGEQQRDHEHAKDDQAKP